MAMRLSGLISGMDTDTVIKKLMNAERLKTTRIENKITTTEWKQDKWSALNSKIYSFYTKQLSKLRFQGSFAVKKVSSSNINKVEVTAGSNAPEGTHQIKVKQLASSQFVTGAKLGTDVNGKEISSSTKLVDLGFDATDGTSIHIKTAKKEVDLDIRQATTVGDLVKSLQSAGLNANYDSNQKRFFISSKASGVENAFEITTSSSALVQEKNVIRDSLGYDSLSSANKSEVDGYLNEYLNDTLIDDDRDVIESKLLEIKHKHVRNKYIDDYIDNFNANQEDVDDLTEAIKNSDEGKSLDDEALKKAVQKRIKTDAEADATAKYDAWKNGDTGENIFFKAQQTLTNDLNNYFTNYHNGSGNPITQESSSLTKLGLGEVKNIAGTILMNNSTDRVVQATDAIIDYNGVELTDSSNNFSVNGLTLTLKSVTAGLNTDNDTSDDEVISLSVAGNTEAVYEMIKDFVNTYNELLLDMNESYNAASSRGYDPLTNEEKDSMTDEEIENWEKKIKDSLLRRDNTLGGLISAFRTDLTESVVVNGKSYSLASFGISSKDYKEKGALHITGDEDDATTSAMKNKLMDALANNPEEVMGVMSKLADNLYGTLMDKMKTSTLSSALTVYNDKEISKTLTSYKEDLSGLEKKLTAIEDRYYKQFAAMETAMAKMNSQSSALASMLGISPQQ